MKRFTQSFMALSMMAALGACSAKVEGGVVEIPGQPQAGSMLDGVWVGSGTGEVNMGGVIVGPGASPCDVEAQFASSADSFTTQNLKISCQALGMTTAMPAAITFALQAPDNQAIQAKVLLLNGQAAGWLSLDHASANVSVPGKDGTQITWDMRVVGQELHVNELRVTKDSVSHFTLKDSKLTKK